MGDNYCDAINNRAFCNYDGGDCCTSTVKTKKVGQCEPLVGASARLLGVLEPWSLPHAGQPIVLVVLVLPTSFVSYYVSILYLLVELISWAGSWDVLVDVVTKASKYGSRLKRGAWGESTFKRENLVL